MRTFLLSLMLLMPLIGMSAHAQSKPSERALVVLLNMYTADKSAFLNGWYKNETVTARMTIAGETQGAYGEVVFLYRDQARLDKFLATIQRLDANPAIKAIDAIIYTHGSPTELKLIDESRGQHPLAHWVPLVDISQKTRAIGSHKLRALFADACFSAAHNAEWLKAGFKVASGSIKVDANQDRDVARFLYRWVRGKTFSRGIDGANSEWTTPMLDRLTKDGNSRKLFEGDGALTIDSPVL